MKQLALALSQPCRNCAVLSQRIVLGRWALQILGTCLDANATRDDVRFVLTEDMLVTSTHVDLLAAVARSIADLSVEILNDWPKKQIDKRVRVVTTITHFLVD